MARWKLTTSLWIIALVLVIIALAFRRDRPEVEAAQPATTVVPQDSAATLACDVRFARRQLPDDLAETSGVARGIDRPDVFWTHNDSGGDPQLFGVDDTGRLVQRVRLEGASVTDWEDVEAGPCEGGACLYVADTGDNGGDRASVTIFRIPEPGPGEQRVTATALTGSYPDGRWDSEALFIHGGRPYLVTKGRHGPIAVYRFPAQAGGGSMERITELAPEPEEEEGRVTAATASPDGRWVALATERELRLYEASSFVRGETARPRTFDLAPLRHRQTEAIALADDGSVWLTSEGSGSDGPVLSSLSCRL